MRPGKTIFICAALVVTVSFTVGALACEAESGHVMAPNYVMPDAYPFVTGYSDADHDTYCREFQTEALIGGEARTLYASPPKSRAEEKLALSLRCRRDMCLFTLVREHHGTRASQQAILFPDMPLPEWSQAIQNATVALYD